MAADRHLLIGLLALQTGLIQQSQLIVAFHAWTCDKSRSLADHLVALGHIDAARRAAVEALADLHVDGHQGDVEKSLAALPAGRSTREGLARLADADLVVSLGHAGTTATHADDDADRTASYGIGTATADGLRFRVLRPHARGGLGAVFVALDTELHREVALKQMLDHHADDATSRQRFLVEAEITGGLEHPGIVPVYGLGTYADGRPFYAMRFIRGDSLKEAIDRFHGDLALQKDHGRRSLELRRLLGRFVDACNAIDYAHSRGVLHRDIKPGNIIVGKHGETLVVDWGLAKATGRSEPGAGERTLVPSSADGFAETLPGSALGTPAYMSPEQAEGDVERLGTRSDVYSLGATLYYLLTGRPPVAGDVGEVLAAVRRGDFPPPRQLDSRIDRALEAVCLKAMALRPEDRYASPKALSEDLERWMADEPVSAWREPISRRARRWANRNRTKVTAAAAAIVAGVIGLSAVLVVQTKANADLARSKAAVQARYELAVEAIRTFHTGVSEDFLLKQDQFKDVRDRLLKSASDFYGKLGRLLGQESDPASRRALWRANEEVAELTARVGRPEDALVAHRQVLAAREALRAEAPADPDLTADLARSLTAIAQLLETTGQTQEAEVTYRKAEALLVVPAPAIAEAPATRAILADCRRRLGSLLRRTGRNDEALSVFRQARVNQEALAHAPGASAESRSNLAASIMEVAVLLSETGQTAAAQAECRQAIAIQQELVDANPAVTKFRRSLAASHHNFGVLLSQTDRPAAKAEYSTAMAILQKLVVENPGIIEFRSDLAGTHLNLGLLLDRTGKSSEAAAEYREALAISQKLADDNPSVIEFHSRLALAHNNLAFLLSRSGEPSEATAEYRKAQAILQKLANDNPALTEFRHRLGLTFTGFGQLLLRTGKTTEAEAELRKAVALYQELVGANPAVTEFRTFLAHSHSSLGTLLSDTGRPSAAEAEYGRALSQRQKLADDNPANPRLLGYLADDLLGMGSLLAHAERTDEAIGCYARGEAIRRKLAEFSSATPEDREKLANCQINMADLLRRSARLDEALAACERSRALRERLVEAHPQVPRYRAGLGETYLRLGQVRCDMGDLVRAADAWKRACAHFDGTGSLSPEQTFLRACGHAGLGGLAGRPGSGTSAAEGADQAETAMAVLRQAVAMGYRNLNAYRTESALDPLRNRPDFQALLMDLVFPSKPFAR